ALTGLADDIEMSVEFTADSNSARQRETVTAPSLGAVEEISAGVYRSVLVKWFTEFGHLNRGDMLTSEQHRCHNEKKKFQRRV
ncbi:hypothetical protein, partial [Escherichia coli]|uniref:hypothetical protein n=1 Tax=Escherichia coli TaxID=562 RepID=UPI0013AFF856